MPVKLGKFVLLKEKPITNDIFKKICAEPKYDIKTKEDLQNTVFIFPGNVTDHHNESTTLYGERKDTGLAENLRKEGIPSLYLPTKDVPFDKRNEILKKAIGDIWAAIGNGKNIVLHKQDFINEEGLKKLKHFNNAVKLTPEKIKKLIKEGEAGPSYAGEAVTAPDIVLSEIYHHDFELIQEFMDPATTKTRRDEILNNHAYIKAAYDRGKNALDNPDPWFKKPDGTEPALSISPLNGVVPSPKSVDFLKTIEKWKHKDFIVEGNHVYNSKDGAKDGKALLMVDKNKLTFVAEEKDKKNAYDAAAAIIVNEAKLTDLKISGGTEPERIAMLQQLSKNYHEKNITKFKIIVTDNDKKTFELNDQAGINQYLNDLNKGPNEVNANNNQLQM